MRVAPQIAQVFCKRSMNEKDPARDHVRRLGNASLAGVAGNAPQAIYSFSWRVFNISNNDADARRACF